MMNMFETMSISETVITDLGMPAAHIYVTRLSPNRWRIESVLRTSIADSETIDSECQNMINEIIGVGKYVIGNIRADNSENRVFLTRMDTCSDVIHKDGWWDTFSLSENNIRPGLYLFKIVRATQDKEGHPILILNDICNLDRYDKLSIMYMIRTNINKFAPHYDRVMLDHEFVNKNVAACNGIDVLGDIVDGTFDEPNFLEKLNSPTQYQIDCDAIRRCIASESPEIVYKKLRNKKEKNGLLFYMDVINDYIYQIRDRYHALNLGDSNDIIEMAVAVETYYAAIHKEQKKKKKEEKKEKKAKK